MFTQHCKPQFLLSPYLRDQRAEKIFSVCVCVWAADTEMGWDTEICWCSLLSGIALASHCLLFASIIFQVVLFFFNIKSVSSHRYSIYRCLYIYHPVTEQHLWLLSPLKFLLPDKTCLVSLYLQLFYLITCYLDAMQLIPNTYLKSSFSFFLTFLERFQ